MEKRGVSFQKNVRLDVRNRIEKIPIFDGERVKRTLDFFNSETRFIHVKRNIRLASPSTNILGPASSGFLSSTIAGKKKSMTPMRRDRSQVARERLPGLVCDNHVRTPLSAEFGMYRFPLPECAVLTQTLLFRRRILELRHVKQSLEAYGYVEEQSKYQKRNKPLRPLPAIQYKPTPISKKGAKLPTKLYRQMGTNNHMTLT